MNQRIPIFKIITIGILPSCFKKVYYRLLGYKFGKHVKLGFGSILEIKGKCFIDSYSSIGFFTLINAVNLNIGVGSKIRAGVIIKVNNLTIKDDVTISETVIIRAGHLSEHSNLIIEDRVHIFPGVILDPSYPIYLMEESGIGPKTSIFTHGSYKNVFEGYKVSYGAVNIGKRVELTYNVFIAPGVTIEDDAIVAYGSYVNSNIPEGALAAGSPAKVKRTKNQFVIKPTIEEKIILLKSIISDFLNNMIYLNTIKSFNIVETQYIFEYKSKKKCIDLVLHKLQLNEINSNSLYIILAEDISPFNSSIKSLNIKDLTCSSNLDKFDLELKKYFSRYGVRFKTLN
jgi:acetyltransferase-like isoleucine patch superfamily enzyme